MSKTHVTRILRATVNDQFTSTSSLFTDLRAEAEKGGVKQQAWGFNIKNSKEFFWLLFYPEELHPKDFQWLSDRLGSVGLNDVVSYSLPFELPEDAIKAPVTELVFVTLKLSVEHNDVRDFLDGTVVTAMAAPGSSGGRLWAFADNNDRQACFIFGWESIEAHLAWTQTEQMKWEMQELFKFSDHGEAVYVNLVTHNI